MYPWRYHRPGTLADAERILAEGEDCRPLAGGMSLIPVMKHRLAAPSDLVDLAGISDLAGIAAGRGTLAVRAMTPHAMVAASETVKDTIPALAVLAGGIGDPLVRNRGTIGGSLANNDPAACYPSAVLALGAEIVTTRRRIAAGDFFLGMFETALEPGELIAEVRFPVPAAASYRKFPTRRRGFRSSACSSLASPAAPSGSRSPAPGLACSGWRRSSARSPPRSDPIRSPGSRCPPTGSSTISTAAPPIARI